MVQHGWEKLIRKLEGGGSVREFAHISADQQKA